LAKIVAIIPARSGSKGVVDKNIKSLGGYPLIAWSILAAKKSKLIDRVLVSTDSDMYAEIAKSFGAEVPFLRPKNISRDKSGDIEFVLHALEWLNNNSIEPELFIHIRPTTPFRDPEVIDIAIEKFNNSSNYSSLRSVHEMSETAYKCFEINRDSRLVPICDRKLKNFDSNIPRQSLPITYAANGYIDVLSVPNIKRTGSIHGENILPFITNVSSEVDTVEDFDYLEFQLKKKTNIFELLFEQL